MLNTRLDTGLGEAGVKHQETEEMHEELSGGQAEEPTNDDINVSKSLVKVGVIATQSGIPYDDILDTEQNRSSQLYSENLVKKFRKDRLQHVMMVSSHYFYNDFNLINCKKRGDDYLFFRTIAGSRKDYVDFTDEALSAEGWEYTPARDFARKSFLKKKTLPDGTSYQEKVLLFWSQDVANRSTMARYGINFFADGVMFPEQYQLSYDLSTGADKPDTTQPHFAPQYVTEKSTGKRIRLSPYLDTRNSGGKVRAAEKIAPGVGLAITSDLSWTDDMIISQYNKFLTFHLMFQPSKTAINSRPTVAWTQNQIDTVFHYKFLALLFVTIVYQALGIPLVAGGDLFHRVIATETVNYLSGGYYETRNDPGFVKLMSKVGINWQNIYITEEDLQKLAEIDWLKLLRKQL
jgi:hypothetical protein